jgi:calcineurin-like phosphoesterase family protein
MTTIRLAVVSDPHLVPPGTTATGSWHNTLEFETALPRFELALRQCAAGNPDAIVALGDIANDGDVASHDVAVVRFAAAGPTAWLVPGNHDTRGPDAGLGLENAVRRLASATTHVPPTGGVEWRGLGIAGVGLSHEDRGYRPRLDGGLGQDVASDRLLLVLSHFPLISLEHEVKVAGWKYAGDLVGLADVARPLLARHGPTIALHGHLHLGSSLVDSRVLQIGCPPLIEAPFEITHLVIVTNADRAIEVSLRREQIWPTDGIASWPQLTPARQAWRYDDHGWLALDPGDSALRP